MASMTSRLGYTTLQPVQGLTVDTASLADPSASRQLTRCAICVRRERRTRTTSCHASQLATTPVGEARHDCSLRGRGTGNGRSHTVRSSFLPRSTLSKLPSTCAIAPSKSLRVQRAAGSRATLTIEAAYVTNDEAKRLVSDEGYTVVDVRDNSQFQRSHIRGSVHVPLFVENTDSDPETLIKRQMHSMMTGTLYGTAFTKPNDKFLSTFEQKFTKDSKILVVCQEGLRSTKAMDDLEDAGYQNVMCLKSGLKSVKPGLFEKEGPRELSDAGKVGIAAIQQQISIVLGTILITLILLLKLFPDQAESLFNQFSP